METYTRERVVDEARKYLGVRFKKMGRSMNGLDCVGVLTLVGRDLGHDIEDVPNYTFQPNPELLRHQIRTQSLPASRNNLRPGQIVLLKDTIFPFHCGILGKDEKGLTVINANTRMRQVVEQPIYEWVNGISEVREFMGTRDE